MQLVINTYGSYLRKNGNCLLVKKDAIEAYQDFES